MVNFTGLDPVLRDLVSSSRLSGQLKNFATLVVASIENVPVAYSFAKRINSAIAENVDVMKTLDQSHVDAYLDALLALEAVAEESVVEQLISPVFSGLKFYQQCCLLVNLKKNNRIQNSPSSLETYGKMCLMLLERGLCNSPQIATVAADLVICFTQLDRPEILKTFIKHVLWCKDSSGVEFNDSVWMEELITAAVKLNSVKDALNESVNEQLHHIKALLPSSDEDTELFRLFVVILRLERNPQLADCSRQNFLVNNIVFAMSDLKLIKLTTYLITKGSIRMKQHKSCQTLLNNIGRSLLLRGNPTNRDEPQLIQCFFNVFKYFVSLTGLGLGDANQIVDLFCDRKEWGPYKKNATIYTIFSAPEIWSSLPPTCVCQCLTKLMASWIAGIGAVANSASAGESSFLDNCRYFYSTTSCCLIFYVREVKRGRVLENDFSPLLGKMGSEGFASVMVNIFKEDVKQLPSLKKFPASLVFYRNICLRFLKQNETEAMIYFKNKAPIVGHLKTISCFLWLGDGDCITTLASQLSAVYPIEPNGIISQMINSTEIQQLTDSHPQALDAFRQVLEHRVAFVAEKLEKEGPWRMPTASLPDHPNVEKFLHSCAQQMTYSNFCNLNEGQEFAARLLSLGTHSGYNLQAYATGQNFKTKCEITKMKTNHSAQFARKLIMEEKKNLEMKILSLQQRKRKDANNHQFAAGSNADDDEVVILAPPAKQRKTDLPVIDILE